MTDETTETTETRVAELYSEPPEQTTDADFREPEPPAHEILYDSGEPVEPPETITEPEPEPEPVVEADETVYVQVRQEVETERQVVAAADTFARDVLTAAAQVGINPQEAARYFSAGQVDVVIRAIEERGRQVASRIENKTKSAAALVELREKLDTWKTTLSGLQTAAQALTAKAQERQAKKFQAEHAKARKALLTDVPELTKESEAVAFQRYLLEIRGYTPEQLAHCLDHRPLVAEYRAWRAEKPRKTVLPKGAMKPRKTKPKPKVAKPDRPLTVSEMFKEAGKPTAADILYG